MTDIRECVSDKKPKNILITKVREVVAEAKRQAAAAEAAASEAEAAASEAEPGKSTQDDDPFGSDDEKASDDDGDGFAEMIAKWPTKKLREEMAMRQVKLDKVSFLFALPVCLCF